MSLDTVLQIGKALRSSKKGLKYFSYVQPCPKDTDKQTVLRLNIPVKDDFSFDWENVSLVPENQVANLLYLTFKTSNNDTVTKYIFGDICYGINSTVKNNGVIETKEGGFYRLSNDNASGVSKKSSFNRAKEDFKEMKQHYLNSQANPEKTDDWVIERFRESFSKDEEFIEKLLRSQVAIRNYFKDHESINLYTFLKDDEKVKQHHINEVLTTESKQTFNKVFGSEFNLDRKSTNDFGIEEIGKLNQLGSGQIFLHFDFNGKHWYEYTEAIEIISEQMLKAFFTSSEQGFVPHTMLYKNLCSGNEKNDAQFPGFNSSAKYKSRYFNIEDAKDLFYAKEYSEKGMFSIKGTKIKLIVLPRGENLNARDYIEFKNKSDERKVLAQNKKNKDEEEPLFMPLSICEEDDKITSFDFVFSDYSGSGPDQDLIELSGIEKSSLKSAMDRINQIAARLRDKYGYDSNPKIEYSLLNILGSSQADNSGKVRFKANPKYQSHILKVLPQIYSQNYYHDGILLPALIEKVEFSIRTGDPKFRSLKFNLEFLLSIQNNTKNRYMEITNSKSYQVGLLLGFLSKDLRAKINSFEKNYVGNLTRRIGTLSDFVKFKNEIEQKNIMHDIAQYKRSISEKLSDLLKEIEESEYDKEHAAFGFFESYFRYETKKGFVEKLEKLLTDYASKEDDEDTELIQSISQTLKDHQSN